MGHENMYLIKEARSVRLGRASLYLQNITPAPSNLSLVMSSKFNYLKVGSQLLRQISAMLIPRLESQVIMFC
jgi:hypothetical protein